MMDGEEDYVGQLKEVFDDCDSTGQGHINREDLVNLCEKLQVEDHSDALVERLIGSSDHKRVGFEEFKDGFVAVLSQCADLISTEDEISANSYNEDEAVSPRFVRDGKKYGRRSRPDIHGSETPLDFAELSDIEMDYSQESPVATPVAGRGDTKHHTTPVNQGFASATAMEDLGARPLSATDNSIADVYEGEGLVNKSMGTPGPGSRSGEEDADMDEAEVLKEIWLKQGVGKDGYLSFDELGAICENMGMDKMSDKDLHELFDKLDADNDGRLGFEEFVTGLSQRRDLSVQPNSRPHSAQSRRQLRFGSLIDNDRRTQTPSIFSAITGSGYFSCLDPQVTGYAKSEDLIEFWESFGVGHEELVAVLDSLAFDVDEKINLQELSSALESELLNHDHNSIAYQVAIYSCRNELRYIKGVLETNLLERDKLLEDIEISKRRNDSLIREADERHSTQMKHHESQMSRMEKKYHEQLRSLNTQLDKDRELLTTNAQSEKSKLESENSRLKEEERRLKQELTFHQREMTNLEKDLHAHIDKNSILEKEIDRIRRELSSVNEMQKQMEERESHRTQLKDEQHRFSKEKILALEMENKALRDREDELLLELEELKMGTSRNAGGKDDQRPRRGSLLSDYTMMKHEETSYSDHSDDAMEKNTQSVSQAEEAFRLEILKLKDQHADEFSKLKKVHATENMDRQDAFKNELAEVGQRNRKLIVELEGRVDEEKLSRSNIESDWRRKYETEKAQLKLSASHDRMELMNKLQEDSREQIRNIRHELNAQHDKEIKLQKGQHAQEKEMIEARFRERIEGYETMFDRGADSLRGKLRESFHQLVEEQTQNEIEVEKRHLEATYEAERTELFELLNKEKQSMEDQFNSRLYELEDQMEDVEENVRAECEEEFLEQIQEVQRAFDEERADYEKQISTMKVTIESAEEKLKTTADKNTLLKLKQERDAAFSDRDEMHHEKTKMMLERNQMDREFEKAKKQHREQIATLENRIDEAEKLSSLSTQLKMSDIARPPSVLTSPKSARDNSESDDEKKAVEKANQLLAQRLEESDEQLFKLTAELHLLKSQHAREVQDLKLSNQKAITPETYNKLQAKFDQQSKRCRELEEALNSRSSEGGKLLINTQEENYKKIAHVQFERDEYKTRLLAMRKSLTEVTERLKQQMVKTTKSDNLVRDLYIENSNLVEALYVTEKRQKTAERRQLKLQVKCDSVTGTINRFIPAALEAVAQS